AHPQDDSVGVGSLFYQLGVEIVDLASGGNAPRPRGDALEQGPTGFRRAVPDGFDTTEYESSHDAGHTHRLVLPTRDIEHPPAEGVVYTTQGGPGHEHEVRLDAATLRRLLRNERVSVETSEVASPDPHHHRFDLQDRLGLWGAPPTLAGDSGWWPSP